MKLHVLLALCGFLALANSECSRENCVGNCGCFSTDPPNGLAVEKTPQLVMLTFDDGVNVVNYPTYKELLMTGRKNKGNECPITSTFYVSHDYTNYHYVHQLYRHGSEIAVHSISHISGNEFWKKATEDIWREEMVGMRTIISNVAQIPENEIIGTRAPFLQTAGNITFRVFHDSGFTYDSSMPSRVYTDPPIWPYSLDNGFSQDCQIEPCPNESFGGLWLVPLVNWQLGSFPCAMIDACTPVPETEEDTLEYLKSNFLRHYESNRAPLPVFVHEAWLHDAARQAAYFKFVDWMLEKDDVFLVSVRDVIDYMKNPVSLEEYRAKPCRELPLPNKCKVGKTCHYENVPPGGSRYMVACGKCPKVYPWTGNPNGITGW